MPEKGNEKEYSNKLLNNKCHTHLIMTADINLFKFANIVSSLSMASGIAENQLTKRFCNFFIEEPAKRPSLVVDSAKQFANQWSIRDSVVTMTTITDLPQRRGCSQHSAAPLDIPQKLVGESLGGYSETCLTD